MQPAFTRAALAHPKMKLTLVFLATGVIALMVFWPSSVLRVPAQLQHLIPYSSQLRRELFPPPCILRSTDMTQP